MYSIIVTLRRVIKGLMHFRSGYGHCMLLCNILSTLEELFLRDVVRFESSVNELVVFVEIAITPLLL